MKHVASVSFGKDSLAMLLLLIEKDYPLDEVVFYDTGMEFKCIYRLIDKVRPILFEKNIQFTILRPDIPFEQFMLSKPVKTRSGKPKFGYGWCGGVCRWGTSLKVSAINRYLGSCITYIGIAADEFNRISRNSRSDTILPLVQWNMSEADCLSFCHDRGFYWMEGNVELYSILKRVSCWCCRNKNLSELLMYKRHLPEYFERLCCLETAIGVPMKPPFSLRARFKDKCFYEQLRLF